MKILHPPHFMQNSASYYNHIKTINSVKFTPREIDVIACLLSGKGSKTIAYFLSIEEKTVETHKYNVMRKLDCNSKEGIIEFIERSDRFSALKQHYLSLLSEAMFEKSLSRILSFTKNTSPKCLVVYEKDKENAHFINQLEKHLKLGGVKAHGEAKENHKSLSHFLHYLDSQEIDSLIYLLSKSSLAKLKEADTQAKLELEEVIHNLTQNKRKTLFLLQNEDPSLDVPSAIHASKYINMGTQNNYYFSVLEVLQTLLPNADLEKIISDFKKQYEIIHDSSEKISSQLWSQIIDLSDEESSRSSVFHVFPIKKKVCAFLSGFLVFSTMCLLFFNFMYEKSSNVPLSDNFQRHQSIRSDLPIPADKTLLKRPELLKQIEEALKGKEGIQTVALIGTGGAGKTTLARQYAGSQKSPVVWEINAETNGSLMGSFEALAYALCQSEEERKILKGLQEIKKSGERQDKIILFVKERMNLHPNWFLIFDNVEKFESIQKYFPLDPATWGAGKIIVTTRDANIQNNSHVNHTIHLGELSPQEKFLLFMNIMRQERILDITVTEREQTLKFLNFIPPFPLDISIAAYYLKTTGVSYDKYLEYLQDYSQSFESIQEKILKETNEYTKTRYSIVTLSLEHLIGINVGFKGLLLFVSLLDSQNLPKDLLCTLKNDVIVDDFVYHLKKYSLITNESSINSSPAISIHRSTQAISLNFLVKSLNLKKEDQILKEIGAALEDYLGKAIDEDDLLKMKSHCDAFLSHSELLTDVTQGPARCALGAIYFYLGNYVRAKNFLEQNLASLNRNDKENYSVIARSLGYLGTTYRILGDYEKAGISLQESLAIYRKHLPENHIKEAWILAQIGIVYRDLGNYKLAKDFSKQGLMLYKKYLPADHTKIAWALATLATVHLELENYKEAKYMLEKSLVTYRKYYSNNHIRVAWISAHLGIIYRELGDPAKAKEFLEQSLVVYQKYFFDEHIELVRALRHLGNVYKDLGKYDKAKKILERSLDICEKNYGKDHIDIALGLTNLADVYLIEGNTAIAEKHLKKASLLLQQKNHPTSYNTLDKLADLYMKKSTEAIKNGKTEESQNLTRQARDLLHQALKILETHFSKESPQIQRIQSKLEKLKASM